MKTNRLWIAGIGIAGATAGYFIVDAIQRKRLNTLPYGYGIKLKKSVTINRSAEELYRQWCSLERVAKLMGDVVSVEVMSDHRSRWKVSLPGGFQLKWDAETTVVRENEMIGWKSLDGSDIDIAGYVRFEPAVGKRGTVVRIALQYNPPGGKVGAALATLFGERPGSLIEETLRRFKQIAETGEVAVTQKGRILQMRPKTRTPSERVQQASEDSFPASDAPSWTGTGV
jgi:uncharacterized membrane protein